MTNGLRFEYRTFVKYARESIVKFGENWLNPEQEEAVLSSLHQPTFIVAGPGTGKTTVLAIKLLKHIFVDGVSPNAIIATTFTQKAAKEIRSRVLFWGYSILEHAIKIAEETDNQSVIEFLKNINLNEIIIGTLDSIAEQIITDAKPFDGISPTILEKFVANAFLRNVGLFPGSRYNDAELTDYLNSVTPHFPRASDFNSKLKVISTIADRIRHDRILTDSYFSNSNGHKVLGEIINEYTQHLKNNNFVDFSMLEELFLELLIEGKIIQFVEGIEIVLVDEFQDTNFLQEQIYFNLCKISNSSLTVVGDDDQSIYRFRGATVDIFAKFQTRIVEFLGDRWIPLRIDLRRNYRSTERIVSFVNHFVSHDQSYQAARVQDKEVIIPEARHLENIPVLGMFRETPEELANDLSDFLNDVFRGNGRKVECDGISFVIKKEEGTGDFGDGVLLAPKVREYSEGDNPRARLPLLIRENLMNKYHIDVYNPRGRELGNIFEVQLLLGMALNCIDPSGRVQNTISTVNRELRRRNTILNLWRQTATQFVASTHQLDGLSTFISDWGKRNSKTGKWPREWPLLELIFVLTTWIPFFQNNPEGQVYLEAIARTIAESGQFSSYKSKILHGKGENDDKSVKKCIQDIFMPLAGDEIDVDEEIMPHVPRGVFPIMTIHQSKGLEFPLTVVDVGSDYKGNYVAQRKNRFPEIGDNVHHIEDSLDNHLPPNIPSRSARTGLDRARDDNRRLFYVGYSRAENVLLLVGLNTLIRQSNPLPSIALGYRDNGGTLQCDLEFIPANQWNPSCSLNTVVLI